MPHTLVSKLLAELRSGTKGLGPALARGGRVAKSKGAIRISRKTGVVRMGGRTIRYLFRLPKSVPTGSFLVHNTVRPTRRLGSNGFRA
jgi:hypothetical protein